MRTLVASGSQISNPEISTCPAESVDEEMRCARTISRFSINRCWTFYSRREF